jgi:ABC-type multidrug transport system fused ATPase/permease subunit
MRLRVCIYVYVCASFFLHLFLSLSNTFSLSHIRYGNTSATGTDISEAIKKCNLIETIGKLSKGLESPVGERGARLSGGERQKVSIARALLKNPTLMLCDEVTSSVDAFAERDIVDTLRRASEQRTTLTGLFYSTYDRIWVSS